MPSNKGNHAGAIWKKCDFQIHTPRDAQWSGSPHLAGGTDDEEKERELWADSLITECDKLGLSAIAITDHHDFCFVPYVRRAIERVSNGAKHIWLFPGVEVTCDDAVQCLILFDQSSQEDHWERLFGGILRNIQKPQKNENKAPKAQPCGRDISDLINFIADDAVLKNICVVLPHASNDGAYKSMLRAGFHERFKSIAFDGIYTEKAFASLDLKTVSIIRGNVKDWGTRRRGIVPTGDSRDAKFSQLGVNSCWIRLGEPTSESIRQALLADEARLAYAKPSLAAQRVLSVKITSDLCGSEFELTLNDGFTSVIGGRGSGKSAVLEYLRFGIGRSSVDITDDAIRGSTRERSLVRDTLKDGRVSITLERDGVVEVWTRYGNLADEISIVTGSAPPEILTIPAAQERFRARAFYQKQLSTLVAQESTAAEQITGIAAAESVDSLRTIDQEIATTKRDVQVAFQEVVQYWLAESQHSKAKGVVADLYRRIEALKVRLGESGLSQTNQDLLNSTPQYKLAESLISETEKSIDSDQSTLRRFVHGMSLSDSPEWSKVSLFEEVSEFISTAGTIRAKVQKKIDEAILDFRDLEFARQQLATKFRVRYEGFKDRHNLAVAEQSNLQSLLDDSAKLTAELQIAEALERNKQAMARTLTSATDRLQKARKALRSLAENKKQILQNSAAQIETMSNGILRAAVEEEVTAKECVTAFQDICENQRIRDSAQRCEDRVRDILQLETRLGWQTLVDQLIDIYKHKLQSESAEIDPNSVVGQLLQQAILGPLTQQQTLGIYGRLDDSKISAFLTATVRSYIRFEYRDKEKYIPFEKASPGQQASALLNLLLNQEAGTLIIDQPEDDLDNKVIMDIVRLIQTSKKRRQLIFATHNPNFVVNGDADKVIVLTPGTPASFADSTSNGSARISVETDGAIETHEVRLAITDTMEGGRAAFELRSRKYLFIN